ncbi:MAG: hypothetical protein C6Y22_15030 [Hapalosiphonaceae cyanobacterium JJU2]|nr:MAG: hypothetical protein C6Y22_15030 [Hapalosiphonaceae cyanobacterium JJU2]
MSFEDVSKFSTNTIGDSTPYVQLGRLRENSDFPKILCYNTWRAIANITKFDFLDIQLVTNHK